MLSQPVPFMSASRVRTAAIAVLLLNLSAIAQPTPRDPPGKFRQGTAEGAALTPQVWLDDATRARGGIASGGSAEATVFLQDADSGFGWFMKNDDVFGYGTWGTEFIFGNGFQPGDSISSYMMRFYHSTFDDQFGLGGNDSRVMTELWNGDPFSIMDTGCTTGGISAPIPGTQALFSGIRYGELADLTAVLPEKVMIDCDRVWGVMTYLLGCRGAWRLSGDPGTAFTAPAAVGYNNAAWILWGCEQFTACDTPSGLNFGFCCNSPETLCDRTEPGSFDPCFLNDVPGGYPTFCGDGKADYFLADYHDPGHQGNPVFEGFVSSVFAATDTVMSLVTVSVDAPPATGGSSAGVISLSETEVVLAEGGHNVWLEFKAGDWDPHDLGVSLSAWQFTFDSASYTTGDHGKLTAYTGGPVSTTCAGVGDDAPCEAMLGRGATCDPPGYYLPPGTCSFVYIDILHENFIYKDAVIPIVTIDVSQPNVRPAGTVVAGPPDDPDPFPEGGVYAATIAIHVPADAKGTFTIGLKQFPDTQLVDDGSQFIPLLGIRSAKITIPTGRCCFNLQEAAVGGDECFDVLQTAGTCAQFPGLTVFGPNESCADPCPEVCGDGLVNQPTEQCDAGLAGNSDTEPDACRTDCTLPFCGDDVVDSAEDCDDGPLNSDTNADACRTDCTLPICGDDARDTGEECDGSSDVLCPGACREDCACGFCGDGIIDAGLGEECDGEAGTCAVGDCLGDCTCATQIPTVSQWGLVILTLFLLAGAKGYYGRRLPLQRPSDHGLYEM